MARKPQPLSLLNSVHGRPHDFKWRPLVAVGLLIIAAFVGSTLGRSEFGHRVAAQEPTLSVQPSFGPAGSVVQASGDGFVSSQCGANVFFDSTSGPVLAFASIQEGSFSAEITIPADATLGPHSVIAQGLQFDGEFCGGPSGEEATASFRVIDSEGPFVSDPVAPVELNIDLRDLPVEEPWEPGDPIFEAEGQQTEPIIGGSDSGSPGGAGGTVTEGPSQVASPLASSDPFGTPVLSFDGVPASGFVPPDTVGDVGPNHFIQAVNSQFSVFDKSGVQLAGPSNLNSLWVAADTNDACELNNNGDPDIKYDPLADRWLLSQFVAFTNQCIAISQTSDPVAGGWFLYNFPSPVVNDYPKFGVWPDAYYMGTNAGYPSGDAWAFDRANMLNGNPATFVLFSAAGAFMIPSDLDGATPPPPGAPNLFLRFVDGAEFGGADRLELREFHVDFAMPALSTFTPLPDLATAAFDSNLCGFGFRPQCITQPGTAQLLDTLRGEPMYRLQYRNFGTHETVVVNHTVDIDGADRAGVRWYELRNVAGVWSIFQEGDHSPDATHRWMASVAMDKFGNMGMGYSVSDATVFPGIRYAGRLAGDPLGTTPQGEFTLIDGTASQSFSRRWGDYSAMSVDPVDDCTFWYTTEYFASFGGGTSNWRTRIGAFKFPECPTPVSIDIKPGGFPNPSKLTSKGVIPVAILTTDIFDATTVDPSTVCFGDAEAPAERDCSEAHGRGHIEDVDGDGDLDLVLHFETQEAGIDPGDAEACLTGETFDGAAIEGCDSVKTL